MSSKFSKVIKSLVDAKVVSIPVDVVGEITPPTNLDTAFDWFKNFIDKFFNGDSSFFEKFIQVLILIGIVILVIVLIPVLLPILKMLIQLIVFIVTLPFVLIGTIFKKNKKE